MIYCSFLLKIYVFFEIFYKKLKKVLKFANKSGTIQIKINKEENLMNKTELIAAIAAKADLTRKDAGVALDAVIGSITDALKANDKVQLIGFGTFEVRKRAARIGKNPQTGADVKIPATKVPVFKAGKALKEIVK